MKKMTLIAASLLATAGASAQFNYDFVEGSIVMFDNGGNDDTGYQISGSHELVDGVVVTGSYTEVDDSVSTRSVELGAAKVIHMNEKLDVTAGVSFYDVSVENSTNGTDGMKVNVGARYAAMPQVEVSTMLSNVMPSNSAYDKSTQVKFGASYAINQHLEVGSSYTWVDEKDADNFAVSLRFNF